MKKIAAGVYTENVYPGVILGMIEVPDGMIMIDAPPRPDDGRAWRASLQEIYSGNDQILINLDSHPDRTLGSRIMDTTVLAHKATAQIFKQRPAIFKAQAIGSGSEWESCNGLSGIRWYQPNLVYTDKARLHYGKISVLVEHHPGPEIGSSWVRLPERNILFIGDAVVVKQPPFLADANLSAWIESLDILLSKEYKDYQILSSRSGVVDEKTIRKMRKFLADAHKHLERMGKRKTAPKATEKLADKLFGHLDIPANNKNSYLQRLRYGLLNYYTNTYFSDKPSGK